MTLVDRGTERDILDSALMGCRAGDARIVLIEGAAGCGKSELIDDFAGRAEASDAMVLRAFGSSSERDLPLGVIRQLVSATPRDTLPQVTVADDGLPRVETMQEFCTALGRLSSDAPVVACVDDLQHADVASLRFLRYVIRHSRSTKTLLVLTESLHDESGDPSFGTELLRQPHFQRLRLRRLTPVGTAQVLKHHPEPTRYEGLAEDLYAFSGGNPLLLRALLAEHAAARPAAAGPGSLRPLGGGLFAQALLTCLRRSGAVAMDLAAALAVLGDAATPERAARLAGITASAAVQGVSALIASGILDGHHFRHPTAEVAVLDALAPEVVTDLHRRAAELLHEAGEAPADVARHLMASAGARGDGGTGWADVPWVAGVLREAAERLLDDNEAERAAEVLQFACETVADDRTRVETETRLAAVAWRVSPGLAERHLATPLAALREGRLATERMGPLAQLLVAQGRVAEAIEVRDRMVEAVGGYEEDPDTPRAGWILPVAEGAAEIAASERFLQTTVLGDATLVAVTRTVRGLIASEQPERAVFWCRQLVAQAAERHNAPTWQATFAALQAEAMLRLGDLAGAEESASTALALLPERDSAFAGYPAASLMHARTEMGRHAAVARQLDQPVAETLFRSVHGLFYLRARGTHYLATAQLRTALSDFFEVGRLAQQWGLDRPAVLPWRTDAAAALLRLGQPEQAERLVQQQLSAPDARNPWVRGISLRVRAAMCEPKQRAALLSKAVDKLCKTGDRVELARAMADYGRALQAVGDPNRASMMTRRAWNLAQDCGADALCELIVPESDSEIRGRIPQQATRSEVDAKLSDSERRVATLAARGYTNREISMKLYITVSTVEQHLTRVYRKLSITRRQDLPADLQLSSTEVA